MEVREFIISLLPIFMKYILGFYMMKTVGEYLLFLGRFTQEMTAFIIARGAYRHPSERDEEDKK